MKFFDDNNKKTCWWNRNYFYVGTIVIILLNIFLFWFAGSSWQNIVPATLGDRYWGAPTLRGFLNCFSHMSWEHVLLNMLCFSICGLYTERKIGTLGILGFVGFGAYICGIASVANLLLVNWQGFSGVVYFFYAFIILDYIFSFQKRKKNKTNIILGAIILVFVYLCMCFNDETSNFGFSWYPYDLIHNLIHYSSFIAGIVVSLFIQILEIFILNNYRQRQNAESGKLNSNIEKISTEIQKKDKDNNIKNKE